MAFDPYGPRADLYARFRIDYPAAAVDWVAATAGLTPDSVVLDVGSGTGKLTVHLLDRAGLVVACEPTPSMRVQAERALDTHPAFQSAAARSEALPLGRHTADLVAVGQAVHWFPPERTRAEFRRVCKPGAWLAVLFYRFLDQDVTRALSAALAETGWTRPPSAFERHNAPVAHFFEACRHVTTRTFPAEVTEGWEGFWGGARSSVFSPLPGDPHYDGFQAAYRSVFEAFAEGGRLRVTYETEAVMGMFVHHAG